MDSRTFNADSVKQFATYSRVMALNDLQCTGWLSLNPLDINSNVEKTNDNYAVNRLRDLVEDSSLPFFNGFISFTYNREFNV